MASGDYSGGMEMIGDRKRKTNYDPKLADTVNKRFEQKPEKIAEKTVRAEGSVDSESPRACTRGGLVWELDVAREDGLSIGYTFDKSLERLTAAGCATHPNFDKVLEIMLLGSKSKLTGDSQELFKSMREHDEWASLAFEKKPDVLNVYVDPVGIVYRKKSDGTYEYGLTPDFKYYQLHTFNVSGKNSGTWYGMEHFDDGLVMFLYGMHFSNFPKRMRKGSKHRAQLMFSRPGLVCPVKRAGLFSLQAGGSDFAGSRGVCVEPPF
jgi:hypothetical protein